MPQQFILSFKKNVSLIEHKQAQQIVLQSSDRSLIFKQVQFGLKAAFKTLVSSGATLAQLSEMVQQDEGGYSVLRFYTYLQKFSSFGWLCHSILAEGYVMATAVVITSDYQFPYTAIAGKSKYRLSRFAYCHQVEGQMVLESPLSPAQILLLDWKGTALVSLLAKPHNCDQLIIQFPGISSETVQQFVSLLLSTRILSEVCEDGTILEEANVTLAQWEFHDLLFHTRSRLGRHINPCGSTYRFLGKIEPLPVIKTQVSQEVIELYKPNIETLQTSEPSFTQVLETRKSTREYGKTPITAQQLGEFLYRSARIKRIIQTERGELSSRPYPGGGAIYELELYPVVNICEGIASAIYHYDPLNHQLCRLSSKIEDLKYLLEGVSIATGQQDMPQILIVIAARFQRLAWKYESIAYAVILKDVGVLYQTMYLVATAMGLAPCSIGTGNSDIFTKAIGCDYYTETSVGEFALGSLPGIP